MYFFDSNPTVATSPRCRPPRDGFRGAVLKSLASALQVRFGSVASGAPRRVNPAPTRRPLEQRRTSGGKSCDGWHLIWLSDPRFSPPRRHLVRRWTSEKIVLAGHRTHRPRSSTRLS